MAQPQRKNAAPACVSLQTCPDYAPERLKSALDALLADLVDLPALVQGKEVLLKPNFLTSSPAAKGVCTHPRFIEAVARACLEAGARKLCVGDSPAMGKAGRVARKLGLPELLAPLGVELVEFRDPVDVHLPGSAFPRIQLSRTVLEAEVVINLAKLKTHGLCGMTMAVKNCFGAVVGTDKARWHLRCGDDKRAFARLIVQVCRQVAPRLSLVDAVEAMDGNGPGSGRVRPVGLLAGSMDPFGLDRFLASRICGLGEDAVITFAEDGLGGQALPPCQGELPEGMPLKDWRMPGQASALSRLFKPLVPWQLLRRGMAPPPRIRHKLCSACGQCVQICPAQALRFDESKGGQVKRLCLDKKRCVRCFCCQEICPEGAMEVR